MILSAIGTFVGSQFAGLAADLPRYQTNIGHKIQSIRGSTGQRHHRQLNQTIENLADQITGAASSRTSRDRRAAGGKAGAGGDHAARAWRPGRWRRPSWARCWSRWATLALVLVFVGFILLQKDDLRDRFVRLAGSRDMQRTTVALDEAAIAAVALSVRCRPSSMPVSASSSARACG